MIRRKARPPVETGSGPALAAPREAPPAIQTSGLTRDFPGVRALDDLTIEVPRGSIFGFLGRNGAGKTTTIRLLLGLLDPTAGRARVLGFDPATDSDQV
ncbi:MAG: ATP-binding cassette domain-containing protein, partial [Gemmatimonadota bacterium]